jgi:hypothetical protein
MKKEMEMKKTSSAIHDAINKMQPQKTGLSTNSDERKGQSFF